MGKGLVRRDWVMRVRPPSFGPDFVAALLSDQRGRLPLTGSVTLGKLPDLSASVSSSIMGIK